MMGRSGMRIRIEEASAHAGAEVEIRGWLYHKRSSGSIHFLLVRDGSGVIQAVMAKQEVSPSLFAAAADLTQESSLLVRGTVREDSRAPGGHELTVRDLQVAHGQLVTPDRKSTRLNSSHVAISYAVFCLKKKITINHSEHIVLHYTTSFLSDPKVTNLKIMTHTYMTTMYLTHLNLNSLT